MSTARVTNVTLSATSAGFLGWNLGKGDPSDAFFWALLLVLNFGFCLKDGGA
jgi:hypothetical protein